MSGPTQPKVIGEYWDDDRIKGYLELKPYDDTAADYWVLVKAYQAMIASDFSRFVTFFIEAGRDLNALSPVGLTILDLVSEHQRSEAYIESLQAAGAKRSTEV
ncbi:aminopeptidase [Oleiphilus messinensis]|uniref:Aminopeptidase n=1 Tax=Oleiphilus messinensis TaxID=141451 RepID=A0A1Y0I131_9GAMM|nr:PA4642 family protein [Oleiphilus messinensis]ARU54152.1 aminopeptidase [Oleiphilus messinensis]